MKIILSRKGLDSSAGGKPSPILKNGQIFSIPIPTTDKNSPHRYRDVCINNINASDMLSIVGTRTNSKYGEQVVENVIDSLKNYQF